MESRIGVGEESRGSSGRGMGAMMLANLHGLTRSRPDLLRQGVIGYIVHTALVHPSEYRTELTRGSPELVQHFR
jgi:hypothetical protein